MMVFEQNGGINKARTGRRSARGTTLSGDGRLGLYIALLCQAHVANILKARG
jgi:hypothetical protein